MTITWTTTEQPEPVTKTWRLCIAIPGGQSVLRDATVADLKSALASLPPADRATVVGVEEATAERIVSDIRSLQETGVDATLHTPEARFFRDIMRQFRDACDVVQGCVQKHELGTGGENIFRLLVKSYETAERERDNWEESAAQFHRDVGYYRSLLDQAAKHLGRQVFVCDDGSVSQEPLRAKVPEMVASLRSDLERTAKERDEARMRADLFQLQRNDGSTKLREWQRVVEAAKAWRTLYPLSARTGGHKVDELLAAVDALTAPAAPKPAAELAAEHGFAPHGLPLDVALRGHGSADSAAEAMTEAEADAVCAAVDRMTDEELIAAAEARGVDVEGQAKRMREMLLETARKTMAAKDRLMADPTPYRAAEPPPDPNEREELGRIARDAFGHASSLEWEKLGDQAREGYCNAASAVASRVRKKDGGRAHECSGSPDDLRRIGWSVAVHNDYRMSGVPHTFWLLTKGSSAIKGEGRTDAEALDQIRASFAPRTLNAARPQEEKEPF